MVRRSEKYIVLDLEATCCNDGEFPNSEQEIIQIGVVCVDGDFNLVDTFDEFVRPLKHTQLTDFCKELTGITQEQVDGAETFEVVIRQFDEWLEGIFGRSNRIIMSWGDFDNKLLQRQMKEVDLCVYDGHVNLKEVYRKAYNRDRCGLQKAYKSQHINFVGEAHNALWDAANTARLLPVIFGKIEENRLFNQLSNSYNRKA